MKIIKSVSFFFLGAILFSACFSPPELSSIPAIELNELIFKESKGNTVKDTLIVVLNFKDGDGDLGLDPTQTDAPYNEYNYYLADGSSAPKPVGSFSIQLFGPSSSSVVLTPTLDLSSGTKGKLVSIRTRTEPGYDTLPVYPSVYGCAFYAYKPDSIYVFEKDKAVFDGKYTPARTINTTTGKIYVLYDTFYYQANPKHYNITIKFFEENNDLTYTEFSWEKNSCTTFDGRFPILSDKKAPLEGSLAYRMTSSGFLPLFEGKKLQLEVQISDRAGHLSQVLRTGTFTLRDIQK